MGKRGAEGELSSRRYVVCATQRSGSWLFCRLLSQTRCLGKPGEFLAIEKLRADMDSPTDSLEDTAVRRLQDRATSNGVSGVKFQYRQFLKFSAGVSFDAVFPHPEFVYVDRNDLLGQAISLARAWQDRRFGAGDSARGELRYSFELIERAGKTLAREKANWEWFFARREIQPVRVVYEDLLDLGATAGISVNTSDVRSPVAELAHRLEVDGLRPVSLDDVRSRIQRDETTLIWRQQFLEESTQKGFG